MGKYTTDQVAHIWAQQNESPRSLDVAGTSFSGRVLYSYATPIAAFARDKKGERLHITAAVTWEGNGRIDNGKWIAGETFAEARRLPVVLVNRNSYSVTTSRHQSHMWRALGYGRDRIAHVFTVKTCEPGYNGKQSAPHDYAGFHAHNLADYAERIADADSAAQKARKPEKRAQYVTEAARLLEEATAYAAAFGVKWKGKGADAYRAQVQREAKKAAKLEAARRAEAQRRQAEENARRREIEAADFEAWQRGEERYCPRSYSTDPATGGVYLRRTGEGDESNLETSMGAAVPWRHAVRVFQFIRQVRETGQAFKANGRVIRVGHYHVDSIDEGGNMRAGCHFFAWPQIEELAKREGVFDVAPSADVVEQREGATS